MLKVRHTQALDSKSNKYILPGLQYKTFTQASYKQMLETEISSSQRSAVKSLLLRKWDIICHKIIT